MKAHKKANFGTLGRIARKKLNNDNDIKIIIQGKNSQTGIGKTTLAIELCRYIDKTDDGWNADGKAFIDVNKYLNSYLDYPKGSAFLLDEIGAGADSRRSNSKENVELSQGWQLLRSRNIATIATLPSTSMLDKRLLELADYWILVKSRGIAQPYEIRVNDFNGSVARKPLPGDEHIRFPDLPDYDSDKKYLDSIKDDKVRGEGMKTVRMDEHKKKLNKIRKTTRKETRDKIIRSLYASSDLSYAQIGEIGEIDLTKQAIGAIVREEN